MPETVELEVRYGSIEGCFEGQSTMVKKSSEPVT